MLEVAVAGEADLLMTANMADFETAGVVKVGGSAHIRRYPRHGQATLVIARLDQARDSLRTGIPPLTAIAQF